MPRDARELGGAWTRYQRHEFPPPGPRLAPFVARYWIVRWHYDEPYRQLVVPYPNVHLTFSDGAAVVNGVATGHRVRVLTGHGGVFGVAFRPGGFHPFLKASLSTVTDRTVPAHEILGPPPADPDVSTVEDYLLAADPRRDERAEEAAAIVDRIAAAKELTRVETLAAELGTSVRRLQRLFAEYVGVGPKWVIRRYRLHEVTELLATGVRPDWAALAADLGYADQPHFTRDFKDLFGEPPAYYARRY